MSSTPDISFERGLPANIDSERAILGAVLLENSLYHETSERIKPEDFALDSHQRIFARMAELFRANRNVDMFTLTEELVRHKEVGAVGGVAYLASLTEGLPRRLSIEEYVRIVKDKSLSRQLIGICSNAITRAADQSDDASDVVTAAIKALDSALLSKSSDSDMETVGQYIATHDPLEERKPGLMTGFKQYDDMTCGLHDGEMTLIAGRASMGKTAWAGSLVMNIARRGQPVAVFVNEQAKSTFLARMLCGRAGVSLEKYRKNRLSEFEIRYIRQASDEMKTLPIFWDDNNALTVRGIRNRVRRLQRSEDVEVVLVDQLSHVSADGIYEKGMQRDEIVGAKAQAMKQLIAQDLSLPLIVMHQLSREVLKNKDSRPNLGNLAESGKLEWHADNVGLLHRPWYYDRADGTLRGKGETIIAKQRNGPTGTCDMRYEDEICLWADS